MSEPVGRRKLSNKRPQNDDVDARKHSKISGRHPTPGSGADTDTDDRNLAPTFIIKPRFIEEDDGNRLVFICRLFAQPQPDVGWYMNDCRILPDSRTEINIKQIDDNIYACELRLDDVIDSDAGCYKLKAKNIHGEVSSSINFDFIKRNIPRQTQIDGIAPTFQKKPSILQEDDGRRLIFECRILADPQPIVKWHHNGQPLPSAPRYKIDVKKDGNCYTGQLEIQNITIEDAGKYKVVAKNELGESQASISLNFDADEAAAPADGIKPTFIEKPVINQSNNCSLIRFDCKLLADPKPHIQWLHNGEPINLQDSKYKNVQSILVAQEHDDKTTTTANATSSSNVYLVTLQLKDVDSVLSGDYKCIATNKHGQSQASICLNFDKGKPKLPEGWAPKFPRKPTIRQSGSSLILECLLDSKPKPIITWYHGSDVVHQDARHVMLETPVRTKAELLSLGLREADIIALGGDIELGGSTSSSAKLSSSSSSLIKDVYILTMEIISPTTTDGGSYRCNAQNNLGESNANISLNFQGAQQVITEEDEDEAKSAEQTKQQMRRSSNESNASSTSSLQPKLLSKPQIIFENESRLVRMECHVWSSLKAKQLTYEWFKESSLIKSSSSFKQSIKTLGTSNGGQEYLVTMDIADVNDKHSGPYKCIIKNDHGETTASINLQLSTEEQQNHQTSNQEDLTSTGKAPTFVKKPEIIPSENGNAIKMICLVKSSTRLTISWFNDGQQVLFDERVKQSTKLDHDEQVYTICLDIKDVQISDAGVYKCHIKNIHGECTANLSLNIEVIPIIIQKPKIVKKDKKLRKITIECLIGSNEQPECVWEKEQSKVRQDYRHKTEVKKVTKGQYAVSLDINSATSNDSGQYRLVARNEKGETISEPVHVDMDSDGEDGKESGDKKPKITDKLQSKTCTVGETIELVCKYKCTEKVTITWRKNTRIIRESSSYSDQVVKIESDSNSSRLILKNVNKDSQGTYTVSITNSHGSEESEAIVTVNEKRQQKRQDDEEEQAEEEQKRDIKKRKDEEQKQQQDGDVPMDVDDVPKRSAVGDENVSPAESRRTSNASTIGNEEPASRKISKKKKVTPNLLSPSQVTNEASTNEDIVEEEQQKPKRTLSKKRLSSSIKPLKPNDEESPMDTSAANEDEVARKPSVKKRLSTSSTASKADSVLDKLEHPELGEQSDEKPKVKKVKKIVSVKKKKSPLDVDGSSPSNSRASSRRNSNESVASIASTVTGIGAQQQDLSSSSLLRKSSSASQRDDQEAQQSDSIVDTMQQPKRTTSTSSLSGAKTMNKASENSLGPEGVNGTNKADDNATSLLPPHKRTPSAKRASVKSMKSSLADVDEQNTLEIQVNDGKLGTTKPLKKRLSTKSKEGKDTEGNVSNDNTPRASISEPVSTSRKSSSASSINDQASEPQANTKQQVPSVRLNRDRIPSVSVEPAATHTTQDSQKLDQPKSQTSSSLSARRRLSSQQKQEQETSDNSNAKLRDTPSPRLSISSSHDESQERQLEQQQSEEDNNDGSQKRRRGTYDGLRGDLSDSEQPQYRGRSNRESISPTQQNTLFPNMPGGRERTPEQRQGSEGPSSRRGSLLPIPDSPGDSRRPSIIVPDDNKLRPGEIADRRRRSSIDVRRASAIEVEAADRPSTPLKATGKKPAIIDFQDNVSGTEGHTSYLTFGVEGDPVPNLRFFKGDSEIYEGGRYHVVTDGDTNTVHFCIRKSKPMDESRYKIIASNIHGEDTAYIQLFVSDESGMDFRAMLKHRQYAKWKRDQDDPNWGNLKGVEEERLAQIKEPKRPDNFIKPLQNQKVKQGKDLKVRFECVFSKSGVKAKWYRNNKEIYPNNKFHLNSTGDLHVLEINSPFVDDGGKYTCQCLDTKCSAMLEVEEPDPVYKFTKLLPKAKGQYLYRELVLECTCNSYRAQVTWFRDHECKNPIEPSEKYAMELDKFGKKFLRIKDCQFTDSGDYCCRINSNHDEVTKTTIQISEKKFQIMKPLYSQRAIEDDKVVLECEVDEYDAKVKWYRKDRETGKWKELKPEALKSKEIQVDGKKRRLIIKKCKCSDECEYKCCTNADETSAELFVEPSNKWRKRLEDITVVEDEALVLEVEMMERKPGTSLVWFKGSREIGSQGGAMQTTADERVTFKSIDEKQQLIIEHSKPSDAGDWSVSCGKLKCACKVTVLPAEKAPKINFPTGNIVAEVGKPHQIEIPYKIEGTRQSKPVATLMRNGQPVPKEKCEVIIKDDKIILKWRSPQRDDGDENYEFVFENAKGKQSKKFKMDVQGPPGPPEGPLKVSDVFKDKCKLKWERPKDDGGCPIAHYVVERQEIGSGRSTWTECGVSPDCSFECTDLTPKKEYRFRVKAVNKKGASEPLTMPNTIIAKDPYDSPTKPEDVVVVNWDKDFADLEWKAPEKDGGAPIEKYIIEGKDKFASDWSKLMEVPASQGCLAHVTENLREGSTMQFRVRAVNKAGPGEPSQATKPVILKARFVKPYIAGQGLTNIVVKKGRPIRYEISFGAEPPPEITWIANDQELKKEIGHIEIDNMEKKTILQVTNTTRIDSGRYKLILKNSSGQVCSEADVVVLDKPSRPEGPIVVEEIRSDQMTIKWRKPKDTGGQDLDGYVIEKMNPENDRWVPAGECGPDCESFTIKGLIKNKKYKFRVRAKNKEGESEALETTEPILAKDPYEEPGKPGAPSIIDWSANHADLEWTKPTNDGGAPIEGYIIEMRPIDKIGATWEQAAEVSGPDTKATVFGLIKGQKYQFRVKAKNKAGPGEASEASQTLLAKERNLAPKINKANLKPIRIKAGEQVKFDVEIEGEPAPEVTWFFKGQPLVNGQNNGQVTLDQPEYESHLTLKDCTRANSGTYTIKAKNANGSDEAEVEVVVLGKPSKPKGPLDVSDVHADGCTLNWKKPEDDGGSEVTNYIVEKREVGSNEPWSKVSSCVMNESVKVRHLVPGTKYEFRVIAENLYGTSEPLVTEKPVLAKSPYDTPGAPGAPQAAETTDNSITLTWTKPKNDGGAPIQGYVLEKKGPGDDNWTKVTTEPITGEKFKVGNLKKNSDYEFRVAAVNEAGKGDYSEASGKITARPPASPCKIDGGYVMRDITVKVGENYKIEVPFTGFPIPKVEWVLNGDVLNLDSPANKGRLVGEATETSIILENKNAQRGDDGNLVLNISNEQGSDSTSCRIHVVSAPSPPEGPLQITDMTPETCSLSWKPPLDDGGAPIGNYVVERQDQATMQWVKCSSFVRGTHYEVVGLEPNHKYMFRVMAENQYGLSKPLENPDGQPVTAKFPFDVPGAPGVPDVVDYDETSATLTWPKPTNDGGAKIQGYRLEMRDNSGDGEWVPVAGDKALIKDNVYKVEGLTTGHKYEFRVKAKNVAGMSLPSGTSNEVEAKSRFNPPSKPRDLKAAKIGKNHVDLQWEPPISDGGSKVVGYVVERKDASSNYWIKVNDSPCLDAQCHCPNLIENAEYDFRVFAVNEAGKSEPCCTITPVKVEEFPNGKKPEVIKGPTSKEISIGDQLTLECEATGNPTPHARWFKNGKEVILNQRVKATETENGVFTLTITEVMPNDDGDYTCQVTNPLGSDKCSCSITIGAPPEIVRCPQEINACEHDNAKIKIPFSSSMPVEVQVLKDGKPISESGENGSAGARVAYTVYDDFLTVQVNDVNKSDEAKYKVIIKNKSGKAEAQFDLNVTGLPGAPKGPLELSDITENSATVGWKAPDNDGGAPIEGYVVEMLSEDTPNATWEPVVEVSSPATKAKVKGLKKGKKYKFRVKAINKAGPGKPSEESASFVAKEQNSVPKINRDQLKPIRIKAGEQLKLDVDVAGDPVPEITWTFDDQPIVDGQNNGQVSLVQPDNETHLGIKNCQRANSGIYKIRAKNENGFDEAEVEVIVLGKPGKPEGPLDVSDVHAEGCTLSWKKPKDDGGSELTNYIVEKREVGSDAPWSKVSSCVLSESLKVRHLKPGTKYEFRVIAENLYGTSEPLVTEKPIVAKSPYNTPGAPGAPQAAETTDNSITLTWTKPKNDGGAPVQGYILEKKGPGDDNWTKVTTEPITGEKFKVGNLKKNSDYEFRVAAVNEAGKGDYSEASGKITAQPPARPCKIDSGFIMRDITVKVGEEYKIEVPFTGFPRPKVEWSVNGTVILPDQPPNKDRVFSEVNESFIILLNKSAKREDDGLLTLNISNELGSDSASCRIHVVSAPSPPEGPLQITDMTPETCSLSWKPPLDDGGAPIGNYVVERQDQATMQWVKCSSFVRGTHYEVVGLEPNHKYMFRVMAENQYGLSKPLENPDGQPVTAKFPFDVPGAPGVPDVVDYDETSVKLRWTKPLSDGGSKLHGYKLEVRDNTAGGDWVPVVGDTTLLKDTEYKVDNLITGHNYEFRVKAKNAAGFSLPSKSSSEVTAKSRFNAPGAPRNLRVTKVGKNHVDLKWDKPISDGGSKITGYAVERKEANSSYWMKVNDFGCIDREYTCYNLQENFEYEFRVMAINEAGKSEPCTTLQPVKVQEYPDGQKPEIVRKLVSKNINVGDHEVKLECEAIGKPLPQPRWFKNGKELILSQRVKATQTEDGVYTLTLTEVMDSDEGDYTCQVTNPLGSDRCTCSVSIGSAPSILKCPSEVYVCEKDNAKVKIYFTAALPVDVQVLKDGKPISESGEDGSARARVKYTVFDDYLTVHLGDVDKSDEANYKIIVSNKSGKDEANFNLVVTSLPGPPQGPLEIGEITEHSVALAWRPPAHDGGSRITHYIVQRRDTSQSADAWVTTTSQCKDCHFNVQGLTNNSEYEFRVMAVNENGQSNPLVSTGPVTAKLPFDPPSPPGIPAVTQIGGDFVNLEWTKPQSDGGSRVLGYWIEKREVGSETWQRVNPSVMCLANQINVKNLIEDRKYEFRVFAENAAGLSKPSSNSSEALIRDPNAMEAPNIVVPLKPMVGLENKSIELECTIQGNPKPSVTWFKGVRELRDGGKYCMTQESAPGGGVVHKLMISRVYGEDEDEYSCRASNKAGSRTTRADVTIQTAPKLFVPPRLAADLASFDCGENVTLKIPFTGKPKPTVHWYKGDEEIEPGAHFDIDVDERHTTLTIRDASRLDSGLYRVVVENKLGQDSAQINVGISDKPDPPRFPMVEMTTEDSAIVTWKAPLWDGGSHVTNYVIEKRELPMTSWVRCASTRMQTHEVVNLNSSKDYEFRVFAENIYGRSEPSDICRGTTKVSKLEKKRTVWPVDSEGKKIRSTVRPGDVDDYDRHVKDLPAIPLPADIKSTPILDAYEILEQIGNGQFGVVHRVRERATGDIYAAKFVPTSSAEEKSLIRREIDTMNLLHHKGLLRLHDAYEDDDEMVLVHEFISGPELFEKIAEPGYEMTEAQVIKYMRQICEAVKHMHDRNVIHLDLKPENLVLQTSNQPNAKLKIVDFGLACRLDPHELCKISTQAADYAAPEIFDKETVGFYTDMWAVGVLAYVLLSGKSPFESPSATKAGEWSFGSGGNVFDKVSPEGKDFIEKLLIKQKEKRMTAHECLDHPWLREDAAPEGAALNSRLLGSDSYVKVRDQMRSRYPGYWDDAHVPIGHISNYSSLRKLHADRYKIHETFLDRRELSPRFVIKPHSTFAYEGQSAKFYCAIASSAPVTVSWYRDNHELKQSVKYMKRYMDNDFNFIINRCKLSDRGEYIIRAENHHGWREEPVFLNVQSRPHDLPQVHLDEPVRRKREPQPPGFEEEPDSAPKFNFLLRPRIIQSGLGVKLLCCLKGKPMPTITWSKDGKELSKKDYTMQHADGVVTLQIAACKPSDSGKYTCHAVNSLGEAKTIADVLVEDRRIPPPSSGGHHQRVSSVNRRRGFTPPPIFLTTSPPVPVTISGPSNPSERPLQHATHTTAKLYSSNFSINTNRYLRRSYKLPPAAAITTQPRSTGRSYATSRFYHYHSPIASSSSAYYGASNIPRPITSLAHHYTGSRIPMRSISSFGRSHSSMG